MNPVQSALAPGEAIVGSIINYIPLIVGAIITFVIGWIIALIISQIVTAVLRAVHLDNYFARIGIKTGEKGKGGGFDVAGFIGWLVEWYILFITIIATLNVLQLPEIARYVTLITNYIPNIIGAGAIIILGVVVADALSKIIGGIAGISRVISPKLLSDIVKIGVLVLVSFAALVELNIAPTIIEIMFAGLVAALVIFFGLAFGLGGKDWAKGILDKAASSATKAAAEIKKGK